MFSPLSASATPKINEFDTFLLGVDENVFGFDVSVRYFMEMEILYGAEEFEEDPVEFLSKKRAYVFIDLEIVLFHVVEEIRFSNIFHHQVGEMLLHVDVEGSELYDAGMIESSNVEEILFQSHYMFFIHHHRFNSIDSFGFSMKTFTN